LTYGQKTSQNVSYMTSWDETVLQLFSHPLTRFPSFKIQRFFQQSVFSLLLGSY